MIVKQKKYKHRKKQVSLEEDKKIRKLTTKAIIEEIQILDKKIKIKRPIFYLEAKDMFFEEINSNG